MVALDPLLADAVRRLRRAGIEDARLEAELLLAHALGCTRVEVMAGTAAARAGEGELAAFRKLLEGRERRVPYSYLVGRAEFYGRTFAVSPAVLVPRPETETLVETALQYLKRWTTDHGPRVLDAGTGSGCIAVTLAGECPAARVVATDLSRAALAVARANAERHGVAGRIRFVAGDLFAPFRRGSGLLPATGRESRPDLSRRSPDRVGTKAEGRSHTDGALFSPPVSLFDLILCNPPYVSEPDLAACMPEVRDHEPRLATCGGPDGLALVRRVLAEAPDRLAPDGAVFMEVAKGQAPAAAAFARDTGRYARVQTVRDLAGVERVVVGLAGV